MRPLSHVITAGLCLAGIAGAFWLVTGSGRPTLSVRAEQSIARSMRSDSEEARRRVTAARLVIDDVHRTNERRTAHRHRLRQHERAAMPPTLPEAQRMSPVPEQPHPVSCSDLLRVDDRLVASLRLEIAATRGLLAEYEALVEAQEREILLHQDLRSQSMRRSRRRRLRNRTFVAAAVVVTVVALAD